MADGYWLLAESIGLSRVANLDALDQDGIDASCGQLSMRE
jgi:hypothetical protein